MERYVNKNQKQLRMGITTGTCSAAAAKAAASLLLLGTMPDRIRIHTPKGIVVEVPAKLEQQTPERVSCAVIKDSGDDPDVTNRARIVVSVEKLSALPGRSGCSPGAGQNPEPMQNSEAGQNSGARQNLNSGQNPPPEEVLPHAFQSPDFPWLFLDGGAGVGRVTKAGLEQRIGQAAINTVPRQMIFAVVGEICQLAEYAEPLLITVSVPEGEKLAERTFNPRLGIEGGISILGTSGILEPMSEKAIVDTIEAQIKQLAALGEKNLIVTPGNYGQGYLSRYLHLDLEKSVKSSNYIGETLDLAVSYGMEHFLLVGNVGKLVKLAAGIMNTHSKVADGRCEIFAVHAVLCGGDRQLAQRLMNCINTEEMLGILTECGLRDAVMDSICQKIGENLQRRGGSTLRCGAVLFSERYGWLGQTPQAEAVLEVFRTEKE